MKVGEKCYLGIDYDTPGEIDGVTPPNENQRRVTNISLVVAYIVVLR